MSVPFAPPGDGGFPHVHFEWHCQNSPCAMAVCTAESGARGSRKGQELTPALGLVYRTSLGLVRRGLKPGPSAWRQMEPWWCLLICKISFDYIDYISLSGLVLASFCFVL